MDSLEYRFSQLQDPRAIAVLGHLEDCLGALPLAASLSRGIAYAQYKNEMNRLAVAVDLRVTDDAAVELINPVVVADTGSVVDRAGLDAQL